jgi:hypothetical protein
MGEQVILPPSIEDVPPPGLALVEELDKLLLVQARCSQVSFEAAANMQTLVDAVAGRAQNHWHPALL